MLRRVIFRLVIAIALIVQGGVAATASDASIAGHCHPMSHDGQSPKCPCCPSKSFGVTCADACLTVAALPSVHEMFNLPLVSMSPPTERPRIIDAVIDIPLRPPIA